MSFCNCYEKEGKLSFAQKIVCFFLFSRFASFARLFARSILIRLSSMQRRPSDSPSSMESPIPPSSESPSYRESRESVFRESGGRFSADGSSSRGCDSTMSNTSSRSAGHGTVRSSSGEGHHVLRAGSADGQRPRRSLTASDSSPEDEETNDPYHRSSFKTRQRISSQSSFDNDDSTLYDNNHSYHTSQNSVIRRPSNVSGKVGGTSNMLSAGSAGMRQTASELFLDSGQNRVISEIRRKSDSPSSDMSCDMLMRIGPNSPPNESMSSPDWTRGGSPRQSGDSEHVLHLRECLLLNHIFPINHCTTRLRH